MVIVLFAGFLVLSGCPIQQPVQQYFDTITVQKDGNVLFEQHYVGNPSPEAKNWEGDCKKYVDQYYDLALGSIIMNVMQGDSNDLNAEQNQIMLMAQNLVTALKNNTKCSFTVREDGNGELVVTTVYSKEVSELLQEYEKLIKKYGLEDLRPIPLPTPIITDAEGGRKRFSMNIPHPDDFNLFPSYFAIKVQGVVTSISPEEYEVGDGYYVFSPSNVSGKTIEIEFVPGEQYAPSALEGTKQIAYSTLAYKPSEAVAEDLLKEVNMDKNIGQAKNAIDKVKIKRELSVVETPDQYYNASYESTFTLEVENISEETLENVYVLEKIPKELAQTAADIILQENSESKVLKEDPIIMWSLGTLEPGESKSVKYTIKKRLEEKDNDDTGDAFIVVLISTQQKSNGAFAPITEPLSSVPGVGGFFEEYGVLALAALLGVFGAVIIAVVLIKRKKKAKHKNIPAPKPVSQQELAFATEKPELGMQHQEIKTRIAGPPPKETPIVKEKPSTPFEAPKPQPSPYKVSGPMPPTHPAAEVPPMQPPAQPSAPPSTPQPSASTKPEPKHTAVEEDYFLKPITQRETGYTAPPEITVEEEEQITTLVELLKPKAKKYKPGEVRRVLVEEGYSTKIANEVVKRLYGGGA